VAKDYESEDMPQNRKRSLHPWQRSDEAPEGKKRGRPSNDSKLQAFHEEARAEFTRIQSVVREERMRCLSDRRFVHIPGAQWEGKLGEQFVNRPMYEVNKVALAIDQIVMDHKENRIDATFVSSEGALNKALAEACAARFRADMKDCNAQKAYSGAYEEGVAGGIGAWRLKTAYEDKYSDDPDDPQRIVVEHIPDADRFVFFDLGSREADKSDARRCWVLCPMTHAEFERDYPDRGNPASWPEEVHQGEFDWATPDTVYVAEVYDVEWQKDVQISYAPPSAIESVYTPGRWQSYGGGELKPTQIKRLWQSEIEEDPEKEQNLLDLGYRKIGEKKRKRKRIMKYLMDGMGVISGPTRIPGCEIPVIMYFAHRYFIDNVERVRGHVRLARDPQQIKNLMVSKLAEFVGVASPEKPMMDPESMEGLKEIWADDIITNNPWLPVKKVTNADGRKEATGPVGWTKPSTVPPTLAVLHETMDTDIKEILSTPSDPAGKVVSHTSGKVVKAAQKQVDAKSALYLSSLADAIRWSARVYLGMMPDVYYQPGRKIKGLGPRGEESMIELQQDSLDEDGNLEVLNDMSRAHFDVQIEIGPSSDTEAAEAVETGIGLLGVTEDPQAKHIILMDILMNMKGAGRTSKGIQKWARGELVKLGIETPTPEEEKMLEAVRAAQQPTPIDQLALAQAEESRAKAANADANRALTLARTENTQAQTVKVLTDAEVARQEANLGAVKTDHDMAMDKLAVQSPPDQSGPQGPLGSS
jgi:hypothetical protein